jgi:hypothetical protein
LLGRTRLLNPNLAAAWFPGGFPRAGYGEADAAIEHFAQAMRPRHCDTEKYRMQDGMAVAHLFAGRFDTASSWAEKSFGNSPSFALVLNIVAASQALAGRMDEARRAMKHHCWLYPALRLSNLGGVAPDSAARKSRHVFRRPAKSGTA